MTLGLKLNKLRKSKGLSLDLMAIELDISKTAIRKWENDESKPSVVNLLKVCDYFETDFYTLLADVSNVNFSHNQIKGENSIVNSSSNNTSFKNSIELIKAIVSKHEQINTLVEQQSKLLDKFKE